MKKVLINEIKEHEKVESSFLVTKKDLARSKAGKPYLNLTLSDNTGEMEARVWEGAEEISGRFSKDDIVLVKGHAVSYRDKVQLNVSLVRRLAGDEYSLSDYLPASAYDPLEMMAELETFVEEVPGKHIKALLKSILTDPELRDRFMKAPAAKSMHHPYLGGLLEHVLSLVRLSRPVVANYEGINLSLVTAGLILHDIGKVYELSYERSFEYTDEGRLLGHIVQGLELVQCHIKRLPDFPEPLALLLKHILISHHGILEFGSPKRPKTLEALIVSHLDDMDAKVNAVTRATEEETVEGGEAPKWTRYHRLLERYLYKGPNFATVEGGDEEEGEGAPGRRATPEGDSKKPRDTKGPKEDRMPSSEGPEKKPSTEPDLFGGKNK